VAGDSIYAWITKQFACYTEFTWQASGIGQDGGSQ